MKFRNPFRVPKSKRVFFEMRGRTCVSVQRVALPCMVCLLAGLLIGAFFGEDLMGSGMPVRVSGIREINRLLQKVSRHFAINVSEDPTVATVRDADLLRRENQSFYRDVENGDRLILWSDRAVLYSTRRDIVLSATVLPTEVVDNRSVASGTTGAAFSAGGQSAKELNYEIRNGTGRVGATKTLIERLYSSGYASASVSNAAKTYPQTVIVKLTDRANAAKDSGQLLPLIGGAFGELPSGEKSSKADILVILGVDQS